MNNGQICVSVCAETADEFIENIERAAEYADVIELRFDCLSKNELGNVLSAIQKQNRKKSLLATFRPSEEGGKRSLTLRERLKFWEFFFKSFDRSNFYADIEFELQLKLNLDFGNLIISSHDFSSASADPLATYDFITSLTNAETLKIVIRADEIADSIAVWKLLEKAKKDNKKIIPIAMGEAGKWTRILGLAHGASMTYASLDTGKETAGGQITAKELIESYRVKELDENTEIYGIIGKPVSHSVSPFIHNRVFRIHNMNAVFIPFEVKNLDEFIKKFIKKETREIELNFKGFSVTIPHKQAIIKYLDEIDETAKTIGAVNTVKIENGKLFGYNTDAPGFIAPLKAAYGDLRDAKVAILGAGGAARACIYALKKENAEVTIFGRNDGKIKNLAGEFGVSFASFKPQILSFNDFDIVVNAMPLGTKGEFENETSAQAEQIKNVSLCYDLVYNPALTRFLREAQSVNVPTIGGLQMLVSQGAAQSKIWTGKDAPVDEMTAIALHKLQL